MLGSIADSSQMDDSSTENREPEKQSGKRRLTRNENEKLRRDKLNMHIAELAKMVPLVASASRKLDKSSVLRLSVNYLRTYYELKKCKKFHLWKPDFLTQDNLSEMLLEAYDGFLFVISEKGTILYVSDLITSLLGHNQLDLLGTSFYDLVHPDDVDVCKEQFQFKAQRKPSDSGCDLNGDMSPACLTTVYSAPVKGHRSFHMRMLSLTNKDQRLYELIQIKYHARPGSRKDQPGFARGRFVMIGVGRLAANQPIRELAVVPLNCQEFNTQHNMEGNIIFVDKQHALCMGRLPYEVLGRSPLEYVLPEDVKFIEFSLQKVKEDGEIPSTSFRSHTKSGDVVYIQSRSCICYDNWTNQPRFILSNNALISATEFQALELEQKQAMLDFKGISEKESSGKSADSDEQDETGRKTVRYEACAESWTVGAHSQTEGSVSPDTSRIYSMEDDWSPFSAQASSSSLTADNMPSSGSFSSGDTVTSNQDDTGSTTTDTCTFHAATSVSISVSNASPGSNTSILSEFLQSTNILTMASNTHPFHSPAITTSVPSTVMSTPALNVSVNPTSSQPHVHRSESIKDVDAGFQKNGLEEDSFPRVERLDAKMTMIQNQLSQQLEYKYGLLERSINQQGRELNDVREQMLKCLLEHPDVQEAYLQRIHTLETKRRQHQDSLKQLQELHRSQQRLLQHRMAHTVAKRQTCPAALGSDQSISSSQLLSHKEHLPSHHQKLSLIERNLAESNNIKLQTNIPFKNLVSNDSDGLGPKSKRHRHENITEIMSLNGSVYPQTSSVQHSLLSSAAVFGNSVLPAVETSFHNQTFPKYDFTEMCPAFQGNSRFASTLQLQASHDTTAPDDIVSENER